MTEIEKLEQKQVKALEDFSQGLTSEFERDLALQLAYEEICKIDPSRVED